MSLPLECWNHRWLLGFSVALGIQTVVFMPVCKHFIHSLLSSSIWFLMWGFSLAWSLPNSLDWLTCVPQCPRDPSASTSSALGLPLAFCTWVLEIRLVFSCLRFKQWQDRRWRQEDFWGDQLAQYQHCDSQPYVTTLSASIATTDQVYIFTKRLLCLAVY